MSVSIGDIVLVHMPDGAALRASPGIVTEVFTTEEMREYSTAGEVEGADITMFTGDGITLVRLVPLSEEPAPLTFTLKV